LIKRQGFQRPSSAFQGYGQIGKRLYVIRHQFNRALHQA
jgi:hypothetical protein